MKPTYSTKRYSVAFGSAGIEFQLKRSKRRTLAITVKAGCDGMGNGTAGRGAGNGDREGAKASRVDSKAADFF